MPIAYSYKRFSSDAQEGNDSIRRQTVAAQKFIDEHPELGLVLDTTLSLVDAGVSAYKGRNLKSGALGIFMDAVRDELIKPGSWLLIESLDRFSRQPVNVAAAELLSLINRGIVVVTLHNQSVYREDDFQRSDGLVNLMGALIAMEGHHREQVVKGQRVAAAWRAKYDKIATGTHVVTKLVPFWLEVNEHRTGFNVIEERASVVREIYARRAAGEGKAKIANDLTARLVPTPKGKSSNWHSSSVEKILTSDSVVGVFSNSKGERYEGYYPPILDTGIYQAVRALRQQSPALGKTAKAHPLTGLIKHDCGSTMRRVNKGANSGSAIKLTCPKCQIGIVYTKALALVGQALMNCQYVSAPSQYGEDVLGLEVEIDELAYEIEDAYNHWRSVKTLEARQVWENLNKKLNLSKDQLLKIRGSNTEVLAIMEEQILIRASNAGGLIDGLRGVTLSASFNTKCDELTIVTISGKTVNAKQFEP